MSYNEHTKKKMQTGIPSEDYRDNWDRVFGTAGIKKEGTPICRFCQQALKDCYCNGPRNPS